MRGELLIAGGIILIFIGFMMIFLGMIMSASGQGEVEGGGVIMIGPIPIVFGTQRGATLAMVLAIILMLLWIVGALLWRRG
ncbi:TIGR00304 family membrane protein [Thermococcus sp.]